MINSKVTEKAYQTIERLKREGKVIPGINDSIFKSLFMEEENKGVLAHIISEILKLDKEYVYNNISFKPTELAKENNFEKGKETDLIVEVDGRIINLEMNKKLTRGANIKSNEYHHKLTNVGVLKGEEYINAKLIVQINFDYETDFFKEDKRVVIMFQLRDEENRYILDENFVNYHINMEKVREKYYNKEKLTKLEKIIMMLQLEEKEKLKKLAKDDMELIVMEKKIEDMSENPWAVCLYDKEERIKQIHDIDVADAHEKGLEKGLKEGLEEGLEKGSKQKEIEIAKNMLKKKMDIKTISEITGLTALEIENLR